jgi:hypothetical protein
MYMSDQRLRQLERRWMETGAKEDRRAYARARKQAGLPPLPRECIRHYINPDHHGHLKEDGTFDLSERQARAGRNRIHSVCAVELWPRELYHRSLWGPTMRKTVFYTEDPDEVTCKTCLKSINKSDERVRHRTHYAPGSKGGRERGVKPTPVCGRNDSDKFTETFSWTMRDVNCPTCHRIMAQGRRRTRVPKFAAPGGKFSLSG